MKKKLKVAALLLLAVGVLFGGIYYTWLITPPGIPDDPKELAKVMASARYKRLPDDRKQIYIDKLSQLTKAMDESQRREMWQQGRSDPAMRDAMREVREKEMAKRMKDYFRASKEEKTRKLDEFIDMMQTMRQQRSERSAGERREQGGPGQGQVGQGGQGQGGGGGEGGEGGNQNNRPDPMQRMQERAEKGNAQQQAMMGEFMRAIRQREQERGIQHNPPPPPPGG